MWHLASRALWKSLDVGWWTIYSEISSSQHIRPSTSVVRAEWHALQSILVCQISHRSGLLGYSEYIGGKFRGKRSDAGLSVLGGSVCLVTRMTEETRYSGCDKLVGTIS